MSRYILVPKSQDSGLRDNGDFLLVPTEGLTEEPKSIELPRGIVLRLETGKSIIGLDQLLMKMSRSNIGRSKDGLVTIGSRVMDTKFDEFVVDCCKGQFSECYEDLYCLLRENGITF